MAFRKDHPTTASPPWMESERLSERARGVRRPLEDRLWEKIAVSEPEACWEWQGSRDSGGYGHIVDDDWRLRKAHRVVASLSGLHVGDLDVCHACDNRRCCNPRHLFVGSHADNMRDRDRKGRTVLPPARPGSANSQARLTEQDVDEIRWLHASNHPRRWIATAFCVSPSAVSLIVRRKTWRHVP
jgi:hypothetical protein